MMNIINNHTINNYRYERKFFITELDFNNVENLVIQNPSFFSEIYYERWVNNLYFDTLLFNNFMDNIIGNMYRNKYRIRWYDKMLNYIEKPVLEQKIKKGLLGDKKSFKLIPFTINKGFDLVFISNILKSSNLDPKVMFDIKGQSPVLLNRYKRKYFESNDKKFRITIDSQQSFYKINKLNNTLLQKRTDNKNIILELKHSKEYDLEASKITNSFPFRLTKSSKFARGIELLYV